MSTDESGGEHDSATNPTTIKSEGSEGEEQYDDKTKAAIAEIRRAVGLDRDKVIDIADEVYHAHGDEAEEEEEEWENSFDAPRSVQHTTPYTETHSHCAATPATA